MASVGGVSSSNMNSIYGSRNVISGLASGMDTEGMIENAVSGIKNRISGLQQKRTKWDWKQAGYQGITDKLVQFSQKYTSYTSPTNLLSSTFFNKSVLTTTGGANKDKVSAEGKSTSEVYINAVKQLATAGRGTASGGVLGGRSSTEVKAGDFFDLKKEMTLSNVAGNMTLKYSTNEISLDFGEEEIYRTAEELKNGIIDKLKDVDITFSDGTTVKANERIDVKLNVDTGKISFTDKSTGGNSIEISGASGKLKETLGLSDLTSKPNSFTVDTATYPLHDITGTQGDFLSEKEMSFTLNGVTKKITMPTFKAGTGTDDFDMPSEYVRSLQEQLDEAFGSGRIQVSNAWADPSLASDPSKLQFKFTVEDGSSLRVSGPAAKLMELDGKTSYLNMTETLGDFSDVFNGLGSGQMLEAVGKPENFKEVPDKAGFFYDNDNNMVKKHDDGKYYRVDAEDNFALGYDLKINDKVIGRFTKDTSLDTIIARINTNAEAGVSVSYSKTTGQFTFTAKETGAANGVKLDGGLAKNLFGGLKTKDASGAIVEVNPDIGVRGQDAILSTTINGNDYALVRSTNTFDIDGLSVTLNETFNGAGIDSTGAITQPDEIKDKVSFTSKSDADKIVKTIKEMVDDYNAMLKEIKGLYGTPPAQRTNGSKYEPLTDAQRESMTETQIKGYEETAKQGILYADADLSTLYDKLRNALVPAGADGKALRSMGIDSTYSATEGISITLDEERLRTALANNPDGVRDAFTKSKDGGAPTDGVMTNIKTVLNRYARTTGATKGILIERAGSTHAPTSTIKNTIKSTKDNIDKEIERWEGKLSDSIDRYTRQFTQLEQLIAQMNAQSSSLMGLMGGTG